MDGLLHPDFMDVALELRRQLGRTPGGGAVCVYHHGECVADLWGGLRDDAGEPWCHDTMSPSFSTTKGVASTLLHILRDRGLVDYEDRVSKHWPEFAQAGKESITIRQVLAHQSGLYHIRQMIDHADRMLDWEHMIQAIEQTQPIHEPGTRTGYHGLTYGFLVGEIAQRVMGKSISDLVQEEIAQPLGLDGLYIGTPTEELSRAAQLMWPRWSIYSNALLGPTTSDALKLGASALHRTLRVVGIEFDLGSILDALAPRGISSFDFGAGETLRAAIPAAGGLFTARSLARMYALLAGGGELDGLRLLSPETFQEATRVQAATVGRAVLPFDLRWRLGYHGVATMRGMMSHGFGHFGFGGSGAWADPSRQLAVALIVNSGMGTPFGDMRIIRVSGAAVGCAERRRRAGLGGVAPPQRRGPVWRRLRPLRRRSGSAAPAPEPAAPPSEAMSS
jgi:CubicO group peptidase (beta-lactamase class C family)